MAAGVITEVRAGAAVALPRGAYAEKPPIKKLNAQECGKLKAPRKSSTVAH